LRFQHRHPNIPAGQESEYLIRAFQRDFDVNGPSILRVIKTTLKGWLRYRNHPNARIRDRYAREASSLANTYAGALWAARKWYQDKSALRDKLNTVLHDLYRCYGLRSRLLAPLIGRYIYRCLKKEDARLKAGWRYEPQTFYERVRQPESVTNMVGVPRRQAQVGLQASGS